MDVLWFWYTEISLETH